MQKLMLKVKDKEGKTSYKPIEVIRSWQQADGQHIFLHKNGVYGYKDESPVRAREELENVITSKEHRKIALDWWDRFGKKISAKYYDEEDARLEALADSNLMGPEGDISNLDMVQYQRRTVKNRSAKAYSAPGGWHEWFDKRPDWWGIAKTIELGAFYFRRVAPEDVEEKPIEEEASQDGLTGEEVSTA